jgi:uncharacterized protein YcbX
VTEAGVVGDRRFALIDATSGVPAAPEKHARWREALHLQAQCVEGRFSTIAFPNGFSCPVDHPSLNGLLSDYFGFAVVVAAHESIDGHPDFPRIEHRHPHSPVHVLTTASLNHLAQLRGVETIDARRFRPTVLIDLDMVNGFVEKNWVGQGMRLGEVGLQAIEETTRCGMTFIAQPGVKEDPEILRTILRSNKRHLGINCTVDVRGTIRAGDDVFVGE